MLKTRTRRLLACVPLVALATACGGDDDSPAADAPATTAEAPDATDDTTADATDGTTADTADTTDDTTVDTTDAATGDTTAGTEAPSGEPIKLVLLWEIGGESDVAVDDFQNGAQLALDEINASGGIDGRPVEGIRVAANPIDPQSTNAALRSARDENPTAMVGLIVNSQAAAAISQIEQAAVPVVMVAQADDSVIFGGPSGSEWLWAAQPYSPAMAGVTVDYLVEEKGYQNLGLLGTSDPFGQTLIDASKVQLAEHGLEAFAERTYPGNATDLTEQVLAMDGADVAVNWAYPNPLAVQLQQFAQNGIDIQTYDGPSAPIVVQYGMAPPEAIANLHATLPCNTGAPGSPSMQAFVDRYTEAYGQAPSFSAVSAYDAVLFAAAAIDQADSDVPADVNAAIPSTQLDGACGSYVPDDGHVLFHQAVIVDYAADGSSTNAMSYELPPTAVGGG